jgi:putative MATE family efflux protein
MSDASRLAQRSLAMGQGPILASLVRLAVPTMLAQFMQMAYQLVDTYWLARLGASAVAAVSITFPITMMLVALGGGVAVAGSTFISQYLGRGDQAMVIKTAAQTLIMTVIAAAITTLVGLALAAPALTLVGTPADIRHMALSFLLTSFCGIGFTFLFAAVQAVQRGMGDVMLPLAVVTFTVVMNFFLAPLFIFGGGIVPAGGVVGAAWSTVVCQGLAALVACGLLFSRRLGVGLPLAAFRPDWRFIRRSVSIALPASLEQSTAALNFLVLMGLVASFGTLAIATYGIGLRILSVAMIPAFGLAMATATLVGQSLGAGDRHRAIRTVIVGVWISASVLGLVGLTTFVLSDAIVNIFAPTNPLLALQTDRYIRITASAYAFLAGNQVFLGALRGSGNTKTSMTLAMTQSWLLQLPIAYILSKHTALGITGLWMTTVIKEILIAIVSTIVFLRRQWLDRIPIADDTRELEIVAAIPAEEPAM